MTIPLRSVAAGGACAMALLVATAYAQIQPPPPMKAMMQEIALPGIDRGLRDQDPPRDPNDRLSRPSRYDGTEGNAPLDFQAGAVIVRFKDGVNEHLALGSLMGEVGALAASSPTSAGFHIVHVAADGDMEAVAAQLRTRVDVAYAQPRYLAHAAFKPNDQFYGNQWNFPAIDMERAWDIQPGASSDVVVAILDSGLAYRAGSIRYNSAFPFRLVTGGPVYPALGVVNVPFAAAPELGDASRFVAPRDFVWEDTTPVDLDGHGTHVAGTIGQLTNNGTGVAGMAYNVRLMPVKVISGEWDFIFGSPNSGTDDVVARGIRHAADNGAKVINMSIGRAGPAAPVVDEALRYAVGRGVFIVVAADNLKESGNASNRFCDLAPTTPGIVCVGAVGRTLEPAYYSHTGSTVELSAPGGDQRQGGPTGGILQQTLGLDLLLTFELPPAQFGPPRADTFDYYYAQGTSMAAPHVAGFAALLIQQGITDPAAIEAAMKQFATDKGPAGRDDAYGVGIINPRATLRGLGLAR